MIEYVASVYAGIAVFVVGFAIGERMSFVNPQYHRAFFIGLLWPFVAAQLLAAWWFDFYLGDWLDEKRTEWNQWRCDHSAAEDEHVWCPDCRYEFGGGDDR